MHYHNVQDEPGGRVDYCVDHGELLGTEVYLCDCGSFHGCVICEEYDG